MIPVSAKGHPQCREVEAGCLLLLLGALIAICFIWQTLVK